MFKAYTKKDFFNMKKDIRKIFKINIFQRFINEFKSAFYISKLIIDIEPEVKNSPMNLEEVTNIVTYLLEQIVDKRFNESVVEGEVVLFQYDKAKFFKAAAVYDFGNNGIKYSISLMSYQIFWSGIIGGILCPKFVLYRALATVGHERRHFIQPIELRGIEGTVNMFYFKHNHQACEIDAEVAGYLFAKQILNL